MPQLGGRGRGDLHVTVRVVVPTKLSKEQRRLLDQLAKLLPAPELGAKERSIFDRVKGIFD